MRKINEKPDSSVLNEPVTYGKEFNRYGWGLLQALLGSLQKASAWDVYDSEIEAFIASLLEPDYRT